MTADHEVRMMEEIGNLEAEIERLRAALTEIDSWRYDTLGTRPKVRGPYDCSAEITEAFDRGAGMAFYRCSSRAREALRVNEQSAK